MIVMLFSPNLGNSAASAAAPEPVAGAGLAGGSALGSKTQPCAWDEPFVTHQPSVAAGLRALLQ